MKTGEKNTIWQESFLGHTFEAVNSVTKEVLGTYLIEGDSYLSIGEFKSGVDPTFKPAGYPNLQAAVQDTFDTEWHRSREVKRTFTELGFAKGRLPSDLYNSISTYYYNNRNNYALEEWGANKGIFVNWWEVDALVIIMPWKLKVRYITLVTYCVYTH